MVNHEYHIGNIDNRCNHIHTYYNNDMCVYCILSYNYHPNDIGLPDYNVNCYMRMLDVGIEDGKTKSLPFENNQIDPECADTRYKIIHECTKFYRKGYEIGNILKHKVKNAYC